MWRVRRKKDADSSVRTPPLFWLLPPDSLDSRIPQGYPGRSPWLVGSRCGRRQFHDGQPEILNGGDCPDELDHGDGLGDVAVGVEVVGAEDVPFAAAGGEDHHGDALQGVILLDFGQHLAAVHPGKVEVEQDEVRPGRDAVLPGAAQEGHGRLTIPDVVERITDLAVAQGLLGETRIPRVVLNQEDVDDATVESCFDHVSLFSGPTSGSVNRNAVPLPGSDSIQMRPW